MHGCESLFWKNPTVAPSAWDSVRTEVHVLGLANSILKGGQPLIAAGDRTSGTAPGTVPGVNPSVQTILDCHNYRLLNFPSQGCSSPSESASGRRSGGKLYLYWRATRQGIASRSSSIPMVRGAVFGRRARWDVLLVAIAYSLLWQRKFWDRSLPTWRAVLSILFMLFGGSSFLDSSARHRTALADCCRPEL